MTVYWIFSVTTRFWSVYRHFGFYYVSYKTTTSTEASDISGAMSGVHFGYLIFLCWFFVILCEILNGFSLSCWPVTRVQQWRSCLHRLSNSSSHVRIAVVKDAHCCPVRRAVCAVAVRQLISRSPARVLWAVLGGHGRAVSAVQHSCWMTLGHFKQAYD